MKLHVLLLLSAWTSLGYAASATVSAAPVARKQLPMFFGGAPHGISLLGEQARREAEKELASAHTRQVVDVRAYLLPWGVTLSDALASVKPVEHAHGNQGTAGERARNLEELLILFAHYGKPKSKL